MKPTIRKLENFEFIEKKTSGSEDGGVYQEKGSNTKYYIKKLTPESTISEYIGSNIARLIVNEQAPVVRLVRGEDGAVYTASKFIPNFESLRIYNRTNHIPDECFPYGCVAKDNGSFESIIPYLTKETDKTPPLITSTEDINAVAEWVEHGDISYDNLGIMHNNSTIQAAIIDFSLSLGIRDSVNHEYGIRDRDHHEPMVYYSRNYNPQKMTKALEKIITISPEDIDSLLSPLFQNLKECFGDNISTFPFSSNEIKSIKKIQNIIKSNLLKRQEVIKCDYQVLKFITDNSIGKTDLAIQLTPELIKSLESASTTVVSKLYELSNPALEQELLQYFSNHHKQAAQALSGAENQKLAKLLNIIKLFEPISPDQKQISIQKMKENDNIYNSYVEEFPRDKHYYLYKSLTNAIHSKETAKIDVLIPLIKDPIHLTGALIHMIRINDMRSFRKISTHLTPEYLNLALEKGFMIRPKMKEELQSIVENFDNLSPHETDTPPQQLSNQFHVTKRTEMTIAPPTLLPYPDYQQDIPLLTQPHAPLTRTDPRYDSLSSLPLLSLLNKTLGNPIGKLAQAAGITLATQGTAQPMSQIQRNPYSSRLDQCDIDLDYIKQLGIKIKGNIDEHSIIQDDSLSKPPTKRRQKQKENHKR